ncbi:FMN-binding negative transcriptional regulator, partial [Sansalvadorimonas verongulae]|uniref:FMN-binding negative transcriptional regulator n=1 Tax=Sansalvadorimonas verongulae TaxID=2172824 RepID=UPI0018AD12FF
MHIPPKFKETNPSILHQFIRENPLGTLLTSHSNSLDADHIPFHLHHSGDGQIVLQSHIAKANTLWKTCSDGQEVLLIFHGPNAYIVPVRKPSNP